MPTPKQEKLIQLIQENLSLTGERKTMKELMLEAGYSDSQSDSPIHILSSETMKEGLSDFIGLLEDRRKAAVARLSDAKLDEATALQTASVIDILTKNIQLLSGKETEKNKTVIEIVNYGDTKV